MIEFNGQTFREITFVDFEFTANDGEVPVPICMVAAELGSGKVHRLFDEDLCRLKALPFPADNDSLVVAYYSSAEWSCCLSLGLDLPARALDLYTEFRCATNGRRLAAGWGLVGALQFFGLDAMPIATKEAMRALAMRGGPWTVDERHALLDYCGEDVAALQRLFTAMAPRLDVPRALLRARYMMAAARIEHAGIPVDQEKLSDLIAKWDHIKSELIREVDGAYNVYDGNTFKADRWAAWLAGKGIPWPTTPTGQLALDDDTFREMARMYPEVAPIRELRFSLSQLRLADLAVGRDGRNRVILSAFSARTGRNAPSNTRFIFGPAVWTRGLIRPEPGRAIAYIDWSQQEFAIAAALSGDAAMMAAYRSGDPYLAVGKDAGVIPPDGTKKTHKRERDIFKVLVLATQYGMGPFGLATKLGTSLGHARELLDRHRSAYPHFWAWSDSAVDYGMMHGSLFTVFGWHLHIDGDSNVRSLRNFPVQANGAEMLRLACCYATERGIRVIAPVHDALLVEAAVEDIDAVVRATQIAMEDASAAVLGGFRLRSDAKIVRYPNRYMDERGVEMWKRVARLLGWPLDLAEDEEE